jgi:hypothetical protein
MRAMDKGRRRFQIRKVSVDVEAHIVGGCDFQSLPYVARSLRVLAENMNPPRQQGKVNLFSLRTDGGAHDAHLQRDF